MPESTPNPYEAPEPVTPDRGFLPPDEAYREAAPVFAPEHDPLVNPVAQGMSGWTHRVGGVLRRGGWQLAAIFAITHLLPTVVVTVLVLAGVVGATASDLAGIVYSPDFAEEALPGIVAAAAVVVLLALALQMLGYAAATYLAARQAAGLSVTVGTALRYGLRRTAGLTAWQVLSYFVVGLGVAAVAFCCFRVASLLGLIPTFAVAAYLGMVVALVGPAFLFERRGPLRRSSSLLHAAFWPTAGRLMLLGLTLVAGSFVENVFDQALTALDLDPQPAALLSIGATLVAAVLDVPLTMLLFSGVLITYAERRGAEDTVSTVRLVEELR